MADTQGTRLLEGRGAWWAVAGRKVARIPAVAIDEGELTAQAHSELVARGFFDTPKRATYAVTVLTATACNLGCAYCFQNTAAAPEGSSAPPRIRDFRITPDLIAATQSFVAKQMARFGFERSSLLVFGGEPLLNPGGSVQLLESFSRLGLGCRRS